MMGAADVQVIRAMLGGGDRRSIGRADDVAVMALEGTIKAEALFEIQTFALQGLADFAGKDAQLRPQVFRLIEEAGRTGSPAVKARSRHLLVKLKSSPLPA